AHATWPMPAGYPRTVRARTGCGGEACPGRGRHCHRLLVATGWPVQPARKARPAPGLHWHRRRQQAWLPTTTAGMHACSSLERGPVGIAERAPIERDVHLLEEPLAVGRHHLALEPDAGVVHVAPAVGTA